MTREFVTGGVFSAETPAAGDREELTDRQQAILEYLRLVVGVQGYPPTLREIGDAVGLASVSTVAYQLKEIMRKGWILRVPNQPRAVRLVDDAPPAVGRFNAIRDVCEDPDWSAERKVARVLELLGGAA